ncbi:MAG: radical SAM protein [bacterium]|nr:radical SAM protein [bacterium]
MPHSPQRLLAAAARAVRRPGLIPALLAKRAGLAPALDAAYIECAGTCNLDCRFCFSRHTDEPLGIMTAETFARVARRLFPYAYSVNFVGYGEPLLNPRLPRMIRTAKSYGREAHLTTNGVLMDEGRICALIAAGTDSIAVSLDGADAAVHDANRGAGSFRRTVRNMDILRKVMRRRRLERPLLHIDVILTRSNRAQIPALIRLARDLGASCVNLAHLQACGEGEAAESLAAEGRGLETDFGDWRAAAAALGVRLRLPEEFANCDATGCFWDPGRRLAVTWDGAVRPCCFLFHPNRWRSGEGETIVAPPPLGDLRRMSLPSIWRSAAYRGFREAVARREWPAACVPCPLRPR